MSRIRQANSTTTKNNHSNQRNISGAATNLSQNEYTPWNRFKLNPSPFPRYRHVASSHASKDDTLFIIGGLREQSVYGDVWSINHKDDKSFSASSIEITPTTPPPRVGHASTICGNALILFGGDTHKVNEDGLMDDDLYLFNLNSYKWTIPEPIGLRPLGRYGHKISIIATQPTKTKLFLFGGQFDDTYFNDLSMFDLSTFRKPDAQWEFIKPKSFFPPPVSNHTMISYDNKLWVFGGETLQGLINEVFVYDPIVNDWSVIETTGSSPPPIQEHAAVVYKNLMCVVGGKDSKDNYMNSVYFLNLNTLKWFKLPHINPGIMQGRSGHTATLLNDDSILILSGDKNDFARPGENDFHTSDSDLGNGTIMYTLDLSKLSELCPGIFNNNIYYSASETSIVNNSMDNLTPDKNHPVSRNNTPSITNQRQIFPDILTPYVPQGVNTPNTMNNVQTPNLKSAVIVNSGSGSDAKGHKRAMSDLMKPSSPAPNLPLPELLSRTPELPTPNPPHVLALSSIANKLADEKSSNTYTTSHVTSPSNASIETGNRLSSTLDYTIDIDAYFEDGDSIRGSNQFGTPSKPSKLSRSEIQDSSIDQDETIQPSSISLVKQSDFDNSSNDSFSKYSLKQLKTELENIKNVTRTKALEASNYIKELETQVSELKNNSDPNQISNLQVKNSALESEVITLKSKLSANENILGSAFLDTDNLNKIIRSQNTKLQQIKDANDSNSNYLKKELMDLKVENENLKFENEQLKQKLKLQEDRDSELNENVKLYSSQLQELIMHWKREKSIRETVVTLEEDEVTNSSVTKSPIIELNSKLEMLLSENKKVTDINEELTDELETLQKQFDLKNNELEDKNKILKQLEQKYQSGLDSLIKTSKSLEASQVDLGKYKQQITKQQKEINSLRVSRNGSSGQLDSDNETRVNEEIKLLESRFNSNMNGLKAELYVISQERDHLKDEVLSMKKELLSLDLSQL
ncbi:hypothetical protein Kpol_1010p62 [Vanderwaltozyma polyspora DSM 70294]|uniref:Uncharacterized protein n=1 Tax=Vanderwaltozyma polyspora (strain ATCC 22028 / DSM 70294 / BCRC 21397 / CBS 2163 / NBRC 10782 / NRRL Y-8283 / UCD 57-17) TaxID=436907 RepID=A7TIK6_VANPO|nr:uncharacterized protein Kpol_1010p62 [Vanderwaltozyma polyspora DSM 70294]EDO17944.1 hypothetical protein Kpol_1010p62 [Vanderwaltozyma polyspora DSM 70294]